MSMYGAGIIAVCVLFVMLTRWSRLQFTQIFVLGAREVPTEQIEKEISQYLASSTGGVFRASSMLLFRRAALAGDLERTFPQISDVSVNRIFTDRAIEITVTERDPWATFCTGDTCAYIAEDGVAYAHTLARDASLMTLIRQESSGNTDLGAVWCDEECRSAVRTIKNVLERDAHLGALSITYGEDEALTLTTREGWDIRILRTADIPRVTENIKIALETTIKERRKSLDYIDARFGDRVHYQYK
ncbi:MAG: hypothetical protein AAB343_03440 [Patescibacteria group bacterium]